MSDDEGALRYLEEHIPELAEAALRQAYWRALASGSRVLVGENDQLVEIAPDGSRRVVRALEPDVAVIPGQPIELP